MPTRVDTEFTAQPLTYFVRSLGLESSFHSRLARSTILSKINRGFRLGGSLSTFDRSAYADLSSKPAVSISLALDLGPKAQGLRASQRLETNLLILARLAAARQLASRATVDLFGTAAALRFWLLAILPASSKRVWHGRPRLCIVAECKP